MMVRNGVTVTIKSSGGTVTVGKVSRPATSGPSDATVSKVKTVVAGTAVVLDATVVVVVDGVVVVVVVVVTTKNLDGLRSKIGDLEFGVNWG